METTASASSIYTCDVCGGTTQSSTYPVGWKRISLLRFNYLLLPRQTVDLCPATQAAVDVPTLTKIKLLLTEV
jgi:hypothetical protein